MLCPWAGKFVFLWVVCGCALLYVSPSVRDASNWLFHAGIAQVSETAWAEIQIRSVRWSRDPRCQKCDREHEMVWQIGYRNELRIYIYRVSLGECATLQENVPYLKVHRYNPKHLRISEVERLAEIMAREVWKYDSCYTLIDYQIHIKTSRNMSFLQC